MEIKENQRTRLTKRLLRESLLKLLESKPLQSVSVTELCRTAEINRATFYKYYAIPEDILSEIAEQITAELYAMMPESEADYYNGAFLTSICTFLWEQKDIVRLLMEAATDRKLEELFSDLFQRFWELSPYFKSHGYHTDSEHRLVSTLISSGCYHMIRLWLLEDMDKSPEEISALVTKVFS